MKKSIIYILFILTLIASACKSQQNSSSTNTSTSVVEKLRDTVIKVNADTSYSYYEFHIVKRDTVNHLEMVHIASHNGNYVNAPEVEVQGNKLIIKAVKPTQAIPVSLKDKETTTTTLTTTVVPEQDLSWLQESQIWLGRLFLLLVIAVVIIRLLNKKLLK